MWFDKNYCSKDSVLQNRLESWSVVESSLLSLFFRFEKSVISVLLDLKLESSLFIWVFAKFKLSVVINIISSYHCKSCHVNNHSNLWCRIKIQSWLSFSAKQEYFLIHNNLATRPRKSWLITSQVFNTFDTKSELQVSKSSIGIPKNCPHIRNLEVRCYTIRIFLVVSSICYKPLRSSAIHGRGYSVGAYIGQLQIQFWDEKRILHECSR